VTPTALTATPAESAHSAADALAEVNWRANVRALSLRQPRLIDAVRAAPAAVAEWVFARDGSLTAFDTDGRWWAGCSVPLPAARAMLKTLDTGGRVACFLSPTLAAQLRVTLDTLRPDQAVVSINPDLSTLGVLLRCGDFSAEIAGGRLWFAWGDDWPRELSEVFGANPGLATPSQFVRLPTMPAETVEQLVGAAQKVFAGQNAARSPAIAALRDRPRRATPRQRRLCVLAPSTFRLWDDAPAVLADALRASAESPGTEIVRFDSDHPLCSSALALAEAAAGCDAVVAADVARCDVPNVVAPSVAWVTWVTTPRVPPAPDGGPRDAVLLADGAWRGLAAQAGWRADRVRVGGWPAAAGLATGPAPGREFVAIVTDTAPLDPPETLAEFSSHVLLWERIRADLGRDPFGAARDAAAYLDRAIRATGMDVERLDRRLFVESLIVPAYQQGLARVLLRERVPVRIYGAGWEDVEPFASFAGGAVTSRQALRQVAAEAAALVHAWPGGHAHPVDALRRPVVRPGTTERSFLHATRRALAHPAPPAPPAHGPTVEQAVADFLLDTEQTD
jgi:hypothetical protein